MISNNCFSQSDSNGRTLGGMFAGWQKQNLAQFCVIAKDPNWELCDNYYCLEDKTVLNAFLKFTKAVGRRLVRDSTQTATEIETVRPNVGKRTVVKLLLRRLAWSFKRWNSKEFNKWVDAYDPDMVLLQLGDSSFMFDIALYVAKSRSVPLITFCTEGYYFFEKNCFEHSKLDFIFYPLYKRLYNKTVESTMLHMKYAIYSNSKLQNDYSNRFNVPSSVIYTGSSLNFNESKFDKEIIRVSYLGNLGVDRDSALIDVGEVLHGINTNYIIDVYGNADFDMQKRFANAPGINYKGLVSYEEVKRVIEDSDILFHVESDHGYRERQLQYAFSTKIADSISSGKCFVLYAPKELACSEYISDTKAGWLATNKDELRDVIVSILENPKERQEVLSRARSVASQNHDYLANAQKFQDIILSI